jgi:plastocyanin
VILTPEEPRELPPAAEPPVMDQAQLTFFPSVLFVRTHQPTEFRNSDPEMHNVRVREEATKEGTFNVAIPTGESYQHTFERDGFYDVGCDIHPGMSAMIVATSTPYTAVADREGRFSISGVPPGAYTASVQVGKQRFERKIEVGGGRVEIDFSDAIGTQES